MDKPGARMRCIDGDLIASLCGEIEDARRWLDELAVNLCCDDAIFVRHAASLQGFDRIVQTLGEVVGVLRHGGETTEAIAAIRLEDMRARLTQPNSNIQSI